MKFHEATDWLFNQFPSYQTNGVKAYKPSLDNVYTLCKKFDINFENLNFIHVAGTNGKGSVCHFLDSIFIEAGYKTGLFTSPHIIDFTERIRISGKKVSKRFVIEFCKKIRLKQLEINASFFEITWVMALEYFILNKCKICIIETGLGGRLDSTNIIKPILTIITSISHDHENILGNKYSEITHEKAGIIKENIPVIVGNIKKSGINIIKKIAYNINAKIIYSKEFINFDKTIYKKNNYLYNNEIIVRTACEYLEESKNYRIKQFINNGILNAHKNNGYVGRFQTVQDNPKIIIDVAHNEDGIKKLMKNIRNFKFQNLIIIFGASKDKNWSDMIQLFPPSSTILFTKFSNKRSIDINDVSMNFKNNKKIKYFKNIKDSFKSAKLIQNKEDIILICGSFFLISDFFTFFSKKNFDI